jgi:hypothetical protein
MQWIEGSFVTSAWWFGTCSKERKGVHWAVGGFCLSVFFVCIFLDVLFGLLPFFTTFAKRWIG